MVAVQLAAESIGNQSLQLIKLPSRNAPAAAITIRLKPMSHLAGHVRKSAGEPAAGQTVEVWARGGNWLQPNPVGFNNGPLRTAADGSFRTPDNLIVGSRYRVVVRAPGFEPILSKCDRNSVTQVYWNIALRLAAENPAEAERVLRLVPQEPGKRWLPPAIAWKMAATDPARARRLVDEAQRYYDRPQTLLFLALGLKTRDPAAADEAFWKAIEGIDRRMKEGVEYSAMQGVRGVLLPLVEQIDPTVVPEVFWRAVATRPPIDNPRSLLDESPSNLVMLLGWYDREVAAAVFEPVRALMEQTDERVLAEWGNQFQSWSIFDPRAAVARLEQVPVTTQPETAGFARERVAEMLGLSYEDRWRRIWSNYTEMRYLLERDLP